LAKYDTKQLEALKAKGHTLPGTTSYPIADTEDLANAIKAVGRGGADHDTIRKYIMERARAMGHVSDIPDDWDNDGSLKVSKTELLVDVWKADTQHIVYGVVLEPDLADSQGDVVSPREIEKAAHRYLVESRKSDTQHNEMPNKVEIVESYVAPHDMILHGKLVKKGAWVMGARVPDPDLWERVSNPEHPEPLTGFSIGGSGVRVAEGADNR
jgi:hypothetical protein